MTPARKAALQWFHDRGEVRWTESDESGPSMTLIIRMICDNQLQYRKDNGGIIHTLTDAGRRALHIANKMQL